VQDWPTPSTEVIAYLPSVVLAVRAARITFLYRSEGYAMRALFFSGLLRATEYMSWDKALFEGHNLAVFCQMWGTMAPREDIWSIYNKQ